MKTEALESYKRCLRRLDFDAFAKGMTRAGAGNYNGDSSQQIFIDFNEAEKELLIEIESNIIAGTDEQNKKYLDDFINLIDSYSERYNNIIEAGKTPITIPLKDGTIAIVKTESISMTMTGGYWKRILKFRKRLIKKFTMDEEPLTLTGQLIEKHLGCFKGKKNGYTLLDKKDYDYVLKLTTELIETKNLPEGIQAIPNVSLLPFKFISRTYYKLYVVSEGHRKGRKINDNYIHFIHQLFENYTSMDYEGIRKGFSRYDGANYEADKQLITNY